MTEGRFLSGPYSWCGWSLFCVVLPPENCLVFLRVIVEFLLSRRPVPSFSPWMLFMSFSFILLEWHPVERKHIALILYPTRSKEKQERERASKVTLYNCAGGTLFWEQCCLFHVLENRMKAQQSWRLSPSTLVRKRGSRILVKGGPSGVLTPRGGAVPKLCSK